MQHGATRDAMAIKVSRGCVTYDPTKPLSPKKYWAVIGDRWMGAEHVSEDTDYWLGIWRSDVPHREFCMSAGDRAAFDKLPQLLTIFRGAGCQSQEEAEGAFLSGMSWSLDREKAIWFARRWDRIERHRRPFLGTTTILKRNCFAYYSGREEQEIVVDPDCTLTLEIEEL